MNGCANFSVHFFMHFTATHPEKGEPIQRNLYHLAMDKSKKGMGSRIIMKNKGINYTRHEKNATAFIIQG